MVFRSRICSQRADIYIVRFETGTGGRIVVSAAVLPVTIISSSEVDEAEHEAV